MSTRVIETRKVVRQIEREEQLHQRSCDRCNASGEKSTHYDFIDNDWVRLSMKEREPDELDFQDIDLCSKCFLEFVESWLMPGRVVVPESRRR